MPTRTLRRVAIGALGTLLLVCTETASATPSATLRLPNQSLYPGVAIEIQVEATGFDRDPEPRCEADPPGAGRLELIAIVPDFSSSLRIVNGRVFRSETALFTCRYRFVADSPGRHTLGPFRVIQGNARADAGTRILEVKAVPIDSRLRVEIDLPVDPVYLGQRIPLTIEWWLDHSLADRIRSYSIRGELFERDDLFRFVADQAPAQGEQSLEIETASGRIALAAEVDQRKRDGHDFLVVIAHRNLIPLRSGEFALQPARIEVEEVTRWQRDLFGGRRPAGTERIFSRDAARRLIVKAPPEKGRPKSWAGAVGRGFSLEVATDRSVVRIGDPITLTLRVRGDGNLENIGPPPLDVEGGLDSTHFRIPDEEIAGELQDGSKVFRIAIRVLDESVREVPSVDYSWFDPELGRYQTSRSRPIALSVKPARVISAADVVDATPKRKAEERGVAADQAATQSKRADTRSATSAPLHEPASLGLGSADLAIDRDRTHLLRSDDGAFSVQIVAYGGSLLLLFAAVIARRRADTDPEVRRRRQIHKSARKRIDAARSKPEREGLAELTAALREARTALDAPVSGDFERLLHDCDAIIYAPSPEQGNQTDAERIEVAKRLLDQMAEGIR